MVQSPPLLSIGPVYRPLSSATDQKCWPKIHLRIHPKTFCHLLFEWSLLSFGGINHMSRTSKLSPMPNTKGKSSFSITTWNPRVRSMNQTRTQSFWLLGLICNVNLNPKNQHCSRVGLVTISWVGMVDMVAAWTRPGGVRSPSWVQPKLQWTWLSPNLVG